MPTMASGVNTQKLEAVIKLPSGVFRPCAGVSTAILVFTKTEVDGKITSVSTM
jgi:type I restriction enzyme M protein